MMEETRDISRRDEILDAAIEAFAEGGYHGTSMEDIARIVGVRKRALYHYFTSKDELLFEILKQPTEVMIERLGEISSSADRPTEKLRQAFFLHIATMAEHLDELKVLLSETKYLKARRRKQIVSLRDRYESLFRKIIREGMDSGELRPLDVKLVTFSLMGIGNWINQWYRPGGMSPETLASRFWDMICGGILEPEDGATPDRP